MSSYRVAIDVGETFTDVVTHDPESGAYAAAKVPTTPADPIDGVVDALDRLVEEGSDLREAFHATTHGVRVLAERRGARVLLLATQGVGDVYHIARSDLRGSFDIRYRKPAPLVPRADIVEIGGRLDAKGAELEPLDEAALRAAARRARDEGFGAVAVAFLFSYANPQHELRAEEVVREEAGDLPVVLSHRVARQRNEYERTSSAVAEAYTAPAVRACLDRLADELRSRRLAGPLHMMQANGNATSEASARELSLQTLLGAPAGTTAGAVALAKALGRPNLVCVDMGASGCDLSLVVDGEPDMVTERRVEGLPLLMRAVDVRRLPLGGDSLAYVRSGRLCIGAPDEAAAGDRVSQDDAALPSFTDANLVLGRLDPERSSAGRSPLDEAAAQQAVETVAEQLGLDPLALAEGICELVANRTALAIRTLAAEKGVALEDVTLLACGGAGPLCGAAVAQKLGIREVLVPPLPGAFSAWGMLEASVGNDLVRPLNTMLMPGVEEALATIVAELEQEGAAALARGGANGAPAAIEFAIEARYLGDADERNVTIALRDGGEPREPGFQDAFADRFHAAHERRFGHANPGAPLETVAVRATAFAQRGDAAPAERRSPAPSGERAAATPSPSGDGGQATVLALEDLAGTGAVEGPAVIADRTATTVVPAGASAALADHGTLVISIETKA